MSEIVHTQHDEPACQITSEMLQSAVDDFERMNVGAPLRLACMSCGHIIDVAEWKGCRAEKKSDHCPIADYARMLR